MSAAPGRRRNLPRRSWRAAATMRRVRLRPFDRRDLGIEGGVGRDLVEPAVDRGERDRHVAVARRRDLDEQHFGGLSFLHEPQQRRIAAEAAVPIGLAVDLDRAMNQRWTGRGQRDVGGDGVIAERSAAARRGSASPRSAALGSAASRKAAKLMSRDSACRSGSRSNGSNWPERSVGPNATELPAGEKPPISISDRNEASCISRIQNRFSRARAPSRPPSARPQASSSALMAPALAPLMVSIAMDGSSSSRSSTPQVKAAKVPPP